MKKFILPLFTLVLIFVLGACNPWKYVGEYDHKADFSSYKTFGLLNWEKSNDNEVDQEVKQYILLAIKKELEERGYTYQKGEADLMVSVYIIVNQETSYSAYLNQYAGYGGYAAVAVGTGGVGVVGYGVDTYPFSTVSHDYEEGAFVVDLLDRKEKKIVWQGLAKGRVGTEKPTQMKVEDRVNRLFYTMPVKKEKQTK